MNEGEVAEISARSSSRRRLADPAAWIGLVAAAAHAALLARRSGFAQAGWPELAVRSFLRHFGSLRTLYAVLLCLIVAWIARALAQEPARARIVRPLRTTVLALLFFAIATGQGYWPTAATPTLAGTSGIALHGVALALGAALALLLQRYDRTSSPRWIGWLGTSPGLLAALLLPWLLGFVRGALAAPKSAETSPTSVALLSLDTLRADRVGCYGYARPTTPELDAFARSAVRFDAVSSPYPFTLTAHGSMLTGLDPANHGAVPIGPRVEDRLPLFPDAHLVAQSFRAAGFVTAAFVDSSCLWLHPKYGFKRGFDVYRLVNGDIHATNQELHELLADVGGRPLFLFLHCFDIHSDAQLLPYDCDAEDRRLFTAAYRGSFDGRDPADPAVRASDYLRRLNETGAPLGPDELRYISDLYDQGVRSTDRGVGATLELLGLAGFHDRGAILVTSDHGEEFREHGRFLHDSQLFEESLRVPLLLRLPRGEHGGSSVAHPVALRDVAPTLAACAGIPLDGVQGRSLLDLARGADADPVPVFFGATPDALGVRLGPFKLVRQGDRHALWDLAADPGELRDLTGTLPEIEARLEALVEEHAAANEAARARRRAASALELTEEERRRMTELGY